MVKQKWPYYNQVCRMMAVKHKLPHHNQVHHMTAVKYKWNTSHHITINTSYGGGETQVTASHNQVHHMMVLKHKSPHHNQVCHMKAVKHKSLYNTIKCVTWRRWNTSHHITSKNLFHHLCQPSLDSGGGFWTKWSWLCQEGRNQNCTLPLVLPQHQSRAQPPAGPRSSHRSLCHWRPALHTDKQTAHSASQG